MSSPNSSQSRGRKQASRRIPPPRAGSAAHKKAAASRKGKCAAKSSKPRKPSAKYSGLKTQQAIVERAKCAIWRSVEKIIDALINLAATGNYSAAKTLFDLAGVYSLPEIEDQKSVAAPVIAAAGAPAAAPVPASPDDVPEHIDAFFRSMGIEPVCGESKPESAA